MIVTEFNNFPLPKKKKSSWTIVLNLWKIWFWKNILYCNNANANNGLQISVKSLSYLLFDFHYFSLLRLWSSGFHVWIPVSFQAIYPNAKDMSKRMLEGNFNKYLLEKQTRHYFHPRFHEIDFSLRLLKLAFPREKGRKISSIAGKVHNKRSWRSLTLLYDRNNLDFYVETSHSWRRVCPLINPVSLCKHSYHMWSNSISWLYLNIFVCGWKACIIFFNRCWKFWLIPMYG